MSRARRRCLILAAEEWTARVSKKPEFQGKTRCSDTPGLVLDIAGESLKGRRKL